MLTILRRYRISAAVFLCVYLGAQIFGPSLWHFAAVSVQHWWSRGAAGDIISGLAGVAAFIAFAEYRRRERATPSAPGTARRQPSKPWA